MSEIKKTGKLAQIERRAAEKAFLKFTLMRARQKIDLGIAKAVRKYISATTPVENDKIVFMHYNNKYQCNPKYICEEILRQGLKYDIVFVTSKKLYNSFPVPFPEGVRVVKRNTLEHFLEVASAKVWVENAVNFPWEYIEKKPEQFYINPWHGSMGLKRINVADIESKKWRKAAKIAGQITDVMISNSKFETKVYRTSFWPDKKVKILEYGHPRNDVFFYDDEKKAEIRKKVYEHFELEDDVHTILYAPTFRNARNLDVYDIDYDRLIAAAEKRFGGRWVVINRYHFKLAHKLESVAALKNNDRVLDGNSYSDIQELMLASDIGITDYSSWICDYILLGRPAFIYARDIEEYDGERGFYYPLESTPFAVAQNNDEMEANILNFDEDVFAAKQKKFLEDRGCIEDGHAAERVVELIKSVMTEHK